MTVQMGTNIQIQTLPQQVTGTQQAEGGAPKAPPLANLSPGDNVSAQVTEVSGMTVTMETADGTSIQTQFPDGVPVNPGDIVDATLVSTNKSDGTVNLRLNAINGQTVNLESSEMQVYLMEQGIAPSKLNEGAAQVFLRNNISPTPRNVANLVQIATTLPEIPTSVAVMMAENNIPPTQENANILMQWAKEPAPLGQDVQNLSGMVQQEAQVAQFTQSFPETVLARATPEQAQILQNGGNLEQLTQNLGNQLQQLGLENMTPKQAQAAIHEFVAQLPVQGEQAAALESLLTHAFTSTAKGVQAEGTPQPVQTQTQGAPIEGQQQTVQTVQTPGTPNQQPATEQNVQTQPNPVAAEQQAAPQANVTQTQVPGAPAANAATTGQTEAQPAAVQADLPEVAAEQQPASEATAPKVQSEGRRLVATQAQDTSPEIKNEASQILSNLGKMVVRVREGSVREDAQTLREGVRDQQHIAGLTKEGVARMFGQTSAAAQKANDVSAQVRLGNQIEQFYYAQVPFQVMQQQGTAELYVFQRQGQKAEAEKTNVTILIGLDTQHMGRVETVLRSMEEHLNVEFRVESTRVQNYFEDSMKDFKDEMSGIGFPLESVKVSQIREKVTPLNAMKVMEPKQEIRLQGLDIEA